MKKHWHILRLIMEFLGAVFLPSFWKKPVVERMARQVLFNSVMVWPYLLVAGLLTGGIVALSGRLWLEYAFRPELVYSLMIYSTMRHLAPFFAIVLLLIINAGAVAAEMSSMKVSGEIDLLEGMGISSLHYLGFSLLAAMTLSALINTIMLAFVGLVAAAVFSYQELGYSDHWPVLQRMLHAVTLKDYGMMFAKAAGCGLAMGGAITVVAINVGKAKTEIPKAVAVAMRVAALWAMLWLAGLTFIHYLGE